MGSLYNCEGNGWNEVVRSERRLEVRLKESVKEMRSFISISVKLKQDPGRRNCCRDLTMISKRSIDADSIRQTMISKRSIGGVELDKIVRDRGVSVGEMRSLGIQFNVHLSAAARCYSTKQ